MKIIINDSQLKRVILEDSKSTTQEFITKAENIHGDRYDYDKVDYKTARLPVIITCPIHGDFIQRPNDHLAGKGCAKCGKRQKSTTQEFIDKSKKVHGDNYGYDKVDYKNSQLPVIITCPTHGDFTQRPNDHLQGKGCSKCSESKGEKSINEVLTKYNISYIPNSKFKDPQYPIQYKNLGNDKRKNTWCNNHNITLLRYWEKDIKERPEWVMSDLKEKLNII